MHGSSYADNLASYCERIDADSGSVGGGAYIDQIRCVTVMIPYSCSMTVYKLTCKLLKVLLCILPVCAKRNKHLNTAVRKLHLIMKILNQKLKYDILSHPESGHVTDNDSDRIIPGDKLL